ncbi:hypothetical protein L914_16679 [Phytophthora nicotianae]|uniref:Transposase Tc1-like domain-containing protein n=1 Tax=Phytophthora nicotianae TaxID=4792 RepID=W2MLY1_PHYNI|nr:hypothetical protein L914_16679 [Phytophthora nicotianae]
MATFKLGTSVVWEIWRSRKDAASLVRERPRKSKATKRTKDEIARLVAGVPVIDRQTLRSLANATGVPKTTLWRHLKSGWLRRAVSHVKPTLTEEHKQRRLQYCLMHIRRQLGAFKMDLVHIDEKWFNMYKGVTRYYLAPDEGLPYRSSLNKRYIGKVMFLAAIARPRFSGKATNILTAKLVFGRLLNVYRRTSKNRMKGTLVTKNVNMTRKIYKKMLKEKVFPAVRKNGQDNAGPAYLFLTMILWPLER